jgi:protein tyrosine/serine phosphatase
MTRRGRSPLLSLALACLAAGSLGCARTLYNFGTVEEDRIYRSAQPSPLFLRWVLRKHEIKSLVNLRGDTPGFESAFAARHGLRLYSFDLSASRPPTDEDVERFLALVQDAANYPILVHCRNGVDRTGYMVGLHRLEHQDWTFDRAAREMNRYWQFEWLNANPQAVLREAATP